MPSSYDAEDDDRKPLERPKELFNGFIRTTGDAMIIFSAAQTGLIPLVNRRLNEDEREEHVRSGATFIFEQSQSGIKRWTDGRNWSPSRILGNFLIYREMATSEVDNQSSGSPTSMTEEVDLPETSYRFRAAPDPKTEKFKLTRDIYGSLYGLEGVKEGGLIKRTISLNLPNKTYHLVNYYTASAILSASLPRPSALPHLASLLYDIDVEYLEPAMWRQPVKVRMDKKAGRLRYAGELGDVVSEGTVKRKEKERERIHESKAGPIRRNSVTIAMVTPPLRSLTTPVTLPSRSSASAVRQSPQSSSLPPPNRMSLPVKLDPEYAGDLRLPSLPQQSPIVSPNDMSPYMSDSSYQQFSYYPSSPPQTEYHQRPVSPQRRFNPYSNNRRVQPLESPYPMASPTSPLSQPSRSPTTYRTNIPFPGEHNAVAQTNSTQVSASYTPYNVAGSTYSQQYFASDSAPDTSYDVSSQNPSYTYYNPPYQYLP